jgi:hypothetical protein
VDSSSRQLLRSTFALFATLVLMLAVGLAAALAGCGSDEAEPTSGAQQSDDQIIAFLHEHKRLLDEAYAGYVPDWDNAAPGEDPVVLWRQLRDELLAAREALAQLLDAESDAVRAAVEACDRYGREVEALYRIAGDGDVFPEADTPEGEQRLRETMEHWEKAPKAQVECEAALDALSVGAEAAAYSETDREIILYLLRYMDDLDGYQARLEELSDEMLAAGPGAARSEREEFATRLETLRASLFRDTDFSMWFPDAERPTIDAAWEARHSGEIWTLYVRQKRLAGLLKDDTIAPADEWERRARKLRAEFDNVATARAGFERALDRLDFVPEGPAYSRSDLETIFFLRQYQRFLGECMDAYGAPERGLEKVLAGGLWLAGWRDGLYMFGRQLRAVPGHAHERVRTAADALERYAREVNSLFFVDLERDDFDARKLDDGDTDPAQARRHHEAALAARQDAEQSLERLWETP